MCVCLSAATCYHKIRHKPADSTEDSPLTTPRIFQVHNFYDLLMRRLVRLGDHMGTSDRPWKAEIDAVAEALVCVCACVCVCVWLCGCVCVF